MIRIEDQEDVGAFNEAKAEIDDEFDEMEGQAPDSSAKNKKAADNKQPADTNQIEGEENHQK